MQYNSFNTHPTFFQKLKDLDYILLTCILLLGIISALSMYSTDGGEVLFHSKSHITTKPLNAIKIEVPKSGCVTTNIIGKIKITRATNIT